MPAAFLRQIVQEAADQANVKDQQVILEVPDKEVLVLGDKDRLRLAVGNIIDNASKYSPKGLAINIRLTESDNSVTIAVEDHGPGIGPEHLPRIFERFYRVDKNRSARGGGNRAWVGDCQTHR